MNLGIIITTIIAIGFIILFFMSFSITSRKTDWDGGIKANKSTVTIINSLRGLFAVEIVIGHLVKESRYGMPLDVYEKFLFVSVGYFFFTSGFSMICNLKEKGGSYFAGFFKRKILFLFFIAILIFIINCIIAAVSGIFTHYVSGDSLPVMFFNRTNWFIWELELFYLLFYICYFSYHKKNKHRLLRSCVLLMMILAFSTVMFIIKARSYWYISSLAFPFGIIAGDNIEKIRKWFYNFKGWLLSFFLMGVGGLSLISTTIYDSYAGGVLLHNVFCAGALIAILILSDCFLKLKGSRLYKRIQACSFAIYLTQFVFIEIADYYCCDLWERSGIILIGCTVLSCVLQPLINKIKKYMISNI